ncbi:MAG TPA: HAD family hydrolase [Candidatus Aminicenantes bacterium]|nr:HAD family hydrolase [Candidatus Aminicenantes bacterium]
MSPIFAVIFDLDGTLLDTIEDITAASNRVYEALGLGSFTNDEMKTLVGDGAEELIRRVYARRGRPAPSESVIAGVLDDYRREYQARWRDNSRPYDGVPELLAGLRRRGLKTAVLSNKSELFTAAQVSALLPGHGFDIVRGARPGGPLKPDPAPALDIAAGLGVSPRECAFVGDTNVDMATAKAAGMFAVGALWGFRAADELRRHGADALIAAPADLLDLVARPPDGGSR